MIGDAFPFLGLTQHSGRPVYVRADAIAVVYEAADDDGVIGSIINLVSGEELLVREPPLEVLARPPLNTPIAAGKR